MNSFRVRPTGAMKSGLPVTLSQNVVAFGDESIIDRSSGVSSQYPALSA
jgi:hypothetical protein